jgi:hypothetical protein
MRMDIGNPYNTGVQEKLPGGMGQTYTASLILQTRRRGWLLEKNGKMIEGKPDGKDSKNVSKVGFIIEAFIQKCNYAPPFTSCHIPFNFYKGTLDNIASIIDLAVDCGIIKQKGPWYVYGDKKIMGRLAVCDYFESEPEEFEKVKEEVLSA